MLLLASAANRLIGEVVQLRRRHYAKRALTQRSLNVKLGPRHKSHKGRVVWLA